MKKIVIAALLSTVISAPVYAEGFYVGANVGSAQIDSPGFDSSTAFGLLAGYTINENFAAELTITDFGSESGSGITSKSDALGIVGVGSWPINEQFSVYGKLGFAATSIEVSGITFERSGLTYGVGAQFNINQQIGIRAGYDSYQIGDSTSHDPQNVMSLGAVYKF